MLKNSEIEFRVQGKLQSVRQKFYRGTNSYPYLSGDVFANMADLQLVDLNVNSKLIEKSNIIHVTGHILGDFLLRYPEETRNKIIISGNSDTNFPAIPNQSNQLKKLFCQNLACPDGSNRYFTIPIGLENLSLGGSGRKKYHQRVKKFSVENKIWVPPMSPTNPSRRLFRDAALKRNDLFEVTTSRLARNHYFKELKKYQFVLVVEGNGYDTHRLWETLYQGSFPVVLSTPWSESLKYLGLPLLYFNHLEELTVEKLENFRIKNALFNPTKTEVLWAPYWRNLVYSSLAD